MPGGHAQAKNTVFLRPGPRALRYGHEEHPYRGRIESVTLTNPPAGRGSGAGLPRLFATGHSAAPTIARLVLGCVIFPHGAQKMLGWFGGHGFSATMSMFTGAMHIPAAFAFLAILAEFGGSVGLVTGFLSRVAAFGIATVMLVAIATVHAGNGFFMNWNGSQKGEGFEYHLLALGLALIVLIYGAGRASVDRWIARRLESR